MIYGIDIGARRVAIAGPQAIAAALILPDPPTGMWPRTGPSEVALIGGFIAAVVPREAVIWVEQPVAQGGIRMNVQTVARLGMTAGAVFTGHAGEGHLVSPTAWKAKLLGNGHADKDAISQWLWANDPVAAEACQGDQDVFDAACIRAYGVMVAEGRVEEPWAMPRRRRRGAVRAGERAADVDKAGRRSKSAVR